MKRISIDQTAITIRAIHIPIIAGCWIVTVTLVMIVWLGTPVHAEDQLVSTSNSSDLIGKLVKNPDGKTIGKIKDLVINWRSGGYIEYAVLSLGGFLGLGDDCFAVPWETLKQSGNREYFVLNVSEEHLKDASGFVVYRFYDRSSVAAQRGGRSAASPSARMMKGDIGSDLNVFVASAEIHR